VFLPASRAEWKLQTDPSSGKQYVTDGTTSKWITDFFPEDRLKFARFVPSAKQWQCDVRVTSLNCELL
jgi:hypothetical protein